MNLLLFSIGLILGFGVCYYYMVGPLVEAIKTLGDMGKDLEQEFDSLPVEPIQISDNTIYTVMGGSERIH